MNNCEREIVFIVNYSYSKKISIVTVCFNASSVISRTIQSVLNQTFSDYEYCIIDGASSDETLTIIESFSGLFENKHIPYIYISEKDNGIYNAMNKSVSMVNGEWVLFLNAGDEFFDDQVLDDIFKYEYRECDFVYGNVLLYENGMYKKAYIGTINDIKDQSTICHQGSMIKHNILKEYLYDEEYKLAADYDLMLRLNKDYKVFKRVNIMFSIFQLGGVSSKHKIEYLKEMNLSRNTNGVICPHSYFYYVIRLKCYDMIRTVGKKILKRLFYSNKRGWYMDRREAAKYNNN